MKLIRFFLFALATVAALALLLAGAALTPPLQTWFARMELLDQPGIQGSLGSVSASFGRVQVEDLQIERDDIKLTLPALEAKLPLIEAAWHRRMLVHSVVAKGWTIDLTHRQEREVEIAAGDADQSANPSAAPAGEPEKKAAVAIGGMLAGLRLPFEGSLDGVDLEGDVLVSVVPGKPPARVHLTVTGGGLSPGREGSFVIDAARVPDDPDAPGNPASAHCHLVVSVDTARRIDRVAVNADLSASTGSRAVAVTVAASAAKGTGGTGEQYSVDLSRGDRHLAILTGGSPGMNLPLAGKWALDLRDADLAPFIPERPLPSLSVTGSGQFDADAAFARIHAVGRLAIAAGRLDAVAPELGRLGAVTIDATFDATQGAKAIHFSGLSASLSGEEPIVQVKELQAFDFDEVTDVVTVADRSRDFLEVSVPSLPMARLPVLPGGFAFTAGTASGGFIIRSTEGGFALQAAAPLRAQGVTLGKDGRTLARDLDLTVALTAGVDAKQWQFKWSPITVDSGGRRLATIDATGSRPVGQSQPLAVTGTWKADLEAAAALPGLSWITGRSASGDFKGSLGAANEMECKLEAVGHDATHTLGTTINADEDPGGAGEFLAPVKISFGANVSEISVEASWAAAKADPRSEIKLTSENVALEHLRLLAAPLAAAGGVALPPGAAAAGGNWARPGARDQLPFWGDWVGRLTVSLDKLRTSDQDFTDVGGSFEVDRASVQLEGGHAELPSKNMANLEGSILFDPSSAHPYILSGTGAALSNIDSALLLPAQPGEDPAIQGHFTVSASISGTGANLDELIGGTQEVFQLSGVNGIIRILKTDIADAIPESKAPVSDSLGDVGDFVGSVFLGIKGHSIAPAKNKVSKTADSVINFTNQVAEIGYDKISVTAIRGADRSIRLSELEMIAPDEHLRGSGTISYVKGLAISKEPLRVELQLGVHEELAKILAPVGLLSAAKDSLGYSMLTEPVRLGGTLSHIDGKPWHDLLAQAATQKPPDGKKPPGTAAH